MSLALVHSRALLGMQAPAVTVEVHLANGLPSFTLVGLADTEVKEARERVRSALHNSGLEFPNNKRITVNLAPADLPKDSGRFDLPIALGILAASGQIDARRLQGHEFAGELSLSGDLRDVRGALAMSLAASRSSPGHPDDGTGATVSDPGAATGRPATRTPRLVLPPGSAREAALAEAAEVYAARHLMDVVAQFLPESAQAGGAAPQASPDGWHRARREDARADATPGPDMADVRGQAAARRALEIAAAGGHSLLMSGPPGSGKSMLAQRLAGLLPPMDIDEALESAAIASLAGRFRIEHWAHRPTAQPHHSASSVALVGGGSPPRPGEISLAHHGVLFLDELPEFSRAALEALREPLETGVIRISRAARQSEFPARFQLVAAMNPCPCGHLGSTLKACRCTPDQIARYQGRLSGPLLDRIDLQVEVAAVPPAELLQAGPGEPSAPIAARVAAARERARARQGCLNARLDSRGIDAHCTADAAAMQFLHKAAQRLGWSARGMHRALRLARTVADLAGRERIEVGDLAEAVQYRRGVVAQ